MKMNLRAWIFLIFISSSASADFQPIENYFDRQTWSNSSHMMEALIRDRIPEWMQLGEDERRIRFDAIVEEALAAKKDRRLDPYLALWARHVLETIRDNRDPAELKYVGIDPVIYLEKKSKLKLDATASRSEFFDPGHFLSRKKGWWRRYSRRVQGLGNLSLPSYVLSQYMPLQQKELAKLFEEFKDLYTSQQGSIHIQSGDKSYFYELSARERGRIACRVLTKNLNQVTTQVDSYLYSMKPRSGDALGAAWLEGTISNQEAVFYSRTPCLDELKNRNAERIDRIESWAGPVLVLTPTLNLIYMSVTQIRNMVGLFRQSKKEAGDERLLVR